MKKPKQTFSKNEVITHLQGLKLIDEALQFYGSQYATERAQKGYISAFVSFEEMRDLELKKATENLRRKINSINDARYKFIRGKSKMVAYLHKLKAYISEAQNIDYLDINLLDYLHELN